MRRTLLAAALTLLSVGCGTMRSTEDGPVGEGLTVRGAVGAWTTWREFTFDYNRADVQAADWSKVNEIAAHVKANPSLQLGIDGSKDPRGIDPYDHHLTRRRIDAVRNALIQAGVPESSIRTGTFGDPRLTRDRRVEVLFRTNE